MNHAQVLLFVSPLQSTVYSSDVVRFEGTAELTKNGETLQFIVGKHPADSELDLKITLKNKSGADREVTLYPTCSCTSISQETLTFPVSGEQTIQVRLKIGGKIGESVVGITCREAKTDFTFYVAVKVDVVERITAEPCELKIDSRTKDRIRLSFESQVKGISVSDVEFVGTAATEKSSDKGRTSISISPDFIDSDGNRTDQLLVFLVKTTDGHSNDVRVQVTFTDRIRVVPYIVTLKKGGIV